MRIPHHLSRSSTGRWSFVQRVPVDLQAVLDCRLIKRTLKTHDFAQAHVRAVVLGAGYFWDSVHSSSALPQGNMAASVVSVFADGRV